MEVVSMKPILFEEDALDYSNNGIGILHDAIKCEVQEERNGYFGLELEYPVDGEWFSELTKQRLILAKPNDKDEDHVFRIYQIEKDLDAGVVYIGANSITDDLSGNLVVSAKITNENAQLALNEMKINLIEPTHFDFISDIQTKASTEWTRVNPLQAISGVRGSIVDFWGGEIKRTNRTVYLYSRRGKDKVAVIRPGKNIDGFNMVVSTKGIITRVLPFYEYSFSGLQQYEMVRNHKGEQVKQRKYSKLEGETEPTTVLGDVVISGESDKYPLNIYEPIDYSRDEELNEMVNKFIEDKQIELDESETIINTNNFETQLKQYVKSILDTRATRYFTYDNPGVDKPSVEFKVDILQLSDSPEWEKYAKLENIQLTDTVEVYVKKFDVDVAVTIGAILYDTLGERVINITAGSVQTSLSQSQSKKYEDRTSIIERHVNTVVNGVKNTINRTADGLNRKFKGYTEPSADISTEGDIWFKVVGDGEVELFIYTGGRWDPVLSGSVFEAIQQDMDKALSDAQEAKNLVNEAVVAADLATENALSAIADAQEAFDLASSYATQIEGINLRIGETEESFTSIVGIVDGLQIEVGNKVDGVTYNSKMTQIDTAISQRLTQSSADGLYTSQSDFIQTAASLTSAISSKVDTDTYTSKITQLDTNINLRVMKNDVVNQINVSNEGILISGSKLILDGDTTVTGTFRVADANITSLSANKMTTGTLNAANVNIINLNANSIATGQIDTNYLTVRGGTATDYSLIEGSLIESRGLHTRTWFGVTKTHDVRLRMENGYFRARNNSMNWSLYFSDWGISTYADGTGDNDASGYIEFHAEGYSPTGSDTGITMGSLSGRVALETNGSNIFINPKGATVYVSRSNQTTFFDLRANQLYANGIRQHPDGVAGTHFYLGTSYEVRVTSLSMAEGGTFYRPIRASQFLNSSGDQAYMNGSGGGTLNSGTYLSAGGMRTNATNIYFGVPSGSANGKVIVANNNGYNSGGSVGYRPIVASAFENGSSITLKTNVEALSIDALEVILNLSVVEYDLIDDVENGVFDNRQVGLISEHSIEVASSDGMAIDLYKLTSYNTKAIQDINTKIDLTREELVLKIAELETRINNMEAA